MYKVGRMFGKKKIESDEETVALSQAEVDRLLKNSAPAVQKKTISKETEEKIRLLKEKTKAAQKRIEQEEKKSKTSKTAKKAPAKSSASGKTVSKLSVYYDGKLYGTAKLSVKNGKKIVELLSIKK